MDKDNEIYVTSSGELYKKGVEQAIYPQTNYTTQQFYTKEEYEKLQAEYDKLYKYNVALENDYRDLEQENERLKEEVEHYRKEAYRLADGLNKIENLAFIYKQALQEIRDIVREETETRMLFADEKSFCDFCKIQAKINEVIGAK